MNRFKLKSLHYSNPILLKLENFDVPHVKLNIQLDMNLEAVQYTKTDSSNEIEKIKEELIEVVDEIIESLMSSGAPTFSDNPQKYEITIKPIENGFGFHKCKV